MLRVLAGVNGSNIVKGISPMVGKIGQQVFSDKLSIRDVGLMTWGCNTMAFDDEGTPTQSTQIYKNGVLESYLLNIEQAKKLKMQATGNAIKRTLFSKEIEDAPSVFDTNMIIEGDNQPDEALIKGIKRGLLITGVMGAHTGNMVAGHYSMNISSGFLIENGQLVGKVQGAMIAGNIYDLFKSVEAIGSEYEVMHSIFYPMGYAPMVKFSQATIIGK
jgi:PmbA protein